MTVMASNTASPIGLGVPRNNDSFYSSDFIVEYKRDHNHLLSSSDGFCHQAERAWCFTARAPVLNGYIDLQVASSAGAVVFVHRAFHNVINVRNCDYLVVIPRGGWTDFVRVCRKPPYGINVDWLFPIGKHFPRV